MSPTQRIMIQVDRFQRDATHLRYGQKVFNAAYKLYPEETEQLRATGVDPFYDDKKVQPFLSSLERLLEPEDGSEGGTGSTRICRCSEKLSTSA